jgi:hypothetical protein
MVLGVLTFMFAGGAIWVWTHPSVEPPREVPITRIPLTGGPEEARAEISSLAWFEDQLVMLPQYPDRFSIDGHDGIFAIPRARIEAFLDGSDARPIEARRVPLEVRRLDTELPGFDGFEAIVFIGHDVYATVEARPDAEATVGWLLAGRVVGDLERVVIDASRRIRLRAQNDLPNTSYEALVAQGDRLLAIYETNGEVNPHPEVLVFDRELRPRGASPLEKIEYRVTDATDLDARGRFWVTNYHWPGAPWEAGSCPITEEYGQGETHARCATVERLVELTVTDQGVDVTREPPILLELVDDAHARNWEGLVRLGDRGFLVATDEYPESILAFVPRP